MVILNIFHFGHDDIFTKLNLWNNHDLKNLPTKPYAWVINDNDDNIDYDDEPDCYDDDDDDVDNEDLVASRIDHRLTLPVWTYEPWPQDQLLNEWFQQWWWWGWGWF